MGGVGGGGEAWRGGPEEGCSPPRGLWPPGCHFLGVRCLMGLLPAALLREAAAAGLWSARGGRLPPHILGMDLMFSDHWSGSAIRGPLWGNLLERGPPSFPLQLLDNMLMYMILGPKMSRFTL